MSKRFLQACILLLFVTPALATALSEYSALFEKEELNALSLEFYDNRCREFVGVKDINVPVTSYSKEFGSSLESAKQAKESLAQAENWFYAFFTPEYFTKIGEGAGWGAVYSTPAAMVFGGEAIVIGAAAGAGYAALAWPEYECNKNAVAALNHGVDAAQSSMLVLDRKIEEFEFEFGSQTPVPKSRAVGDELEKLGADLKNRVEKGNGLGNKIVRTSGRVRSIQEKSRNAGLGLGRFSVNGIPQAVADLVDNDGSVLKEEIRLYGRIEDALKEGRESLAANRETARLKDAEAASLFSAVSKQELELVPDNAWALVDERENGVQSTEREAEPYYARLEKTGSDYEKARNKIGAAESMAKSQAGGRLSQSIVLFSNGLELLLETGNELDKIGMETEALENGLEKTLEKRIAAAKTAVEAVPVERLGSGEIASEFQRLEAEASGWKGKARGQRIKKLVGFIEEAKKVEKLANAPSALEEIGAEYEAEKLALEDLLGRLKKDGVQVFAEEQVLKRISGETGAASKALELLAARKSLLKSIKQSLLAAGREEFGEELEQGWKKARQVEAYLSNADRTRLGTYSRFFANGRLDVEKAAGKMAEMRGFFNELLVGSEKNVAELLRRRMADLLETSSVVEAAELDKPAAATYFFKTRNDWNIAYDGIIELDLPVKAPAEFEWSGSPGVEVIGADNGAKMLLSGITPFSEYWARIIFEKVVARKKSEKSETVFADEWQARKKTIVSFESDEPVGVILKKEVGFPATFSVRSLRPFETETRYGETSSVSILVQAAKGMNEVEIEYSFASPFELSQKAEVAEDGPGYSTIVYSLDYLNRHEDVADAKIFFSTPVNCTVLDAAIQTDDFQAGEPSQAGGRLALFLKAGEWPAGQHKTALVATKCAENTSQVIEGVEEWIGFAEALNKTMELEKARTDARLGKMDEALSRLLDLQSKTGRNENETPLKLQFSMENVEKLLKEAEKIKESEEGTSYAKSLEKVLQDAGGRKAKITQLVKTGDYASALRESNALSSDLEKAMGQEALAKYKSVETICKTSENCTTAAKNKLNEAKSAIALGRYSDAFAKAGEAVSLADDEGRRLLQLLAEKKKLLAGYSEKKSLFEKAAADFDKAFATPASMGTVSSRKKGDAFARGKLAKEELLKSEHWLDEKTAAADQELSKTSVEEIRSEIEGAEERAKVLQEAVEEVKALAAAEVRQAELRKSQFGLGAEDGRKLEEAKKSAEDGNFLTGYLVASELNQKPLNLPKEAEKQPDNSWLFAAAGLVLLAVLGLVVFSRPEKEKKYELLD